MSNAWLDGCPELPGPDRDNYILDAVNNNLVNFDWVDIQSEIPGHTATFSVLADAAYILLDDQSRFRPQCNAALAQKIADQVGVSMVTAKIMDLRWDQAICKVNATILQACPQMSNTSYSKTWNQKLDAKRNGCQELFADIGKPFVLDNKLAFSAGACLYGFFDTGAPSINAVGQRLWQTIGTHHDSKFCDYSSTIMLIKQDCTLDGQASDIKTILTDPALAALGNYGGVLKYLRQI